MRNSGECSLRGTTVGILPGMVTISERPSHGSVMERGRGVTGLYAQTFPHDACSPERSSDKPGERNARRKAFLSIQMPLALLFHLQVGAGKGGTIVNTAKKQMGSTAARKGSNPGGKSCGTGETLVKVTAQTHGLPKRLRFNRKITECFACSFPITTPKVFQYNSG